MADAIGAELVGGEVDRESGRADVRPLDRGLLGCGQSAANRTHKPSA